MSWTDKGIVKQILKIRDQFKIKEFIETGTFKGVNARFYSQHFEYVQSCESNPEYYKIALEKIKNTKNITLWNMKSKGFLHMFREMYRADNRSDIVFIYLDAHFYDESLPFEKRFVVVEELKELRGFRNCVIAIHDFDNGLGHITYDNIPLGWAIVGDLLKKVNPDFKFYTNSYSTCDIIRKPEDLEGVPNDDDVRENLEYVWSNPDKAFRGILYAVPGELKNGIKFKG